jgi:hypothetical protein
MEPPSIELLNFIHPGGLQGVEKRNRSDLPAAPGGASEERIRDRDQWRIVSVPDLPRRRRSYNLGRIIARSEADASRA